jgi:GNAT superfamily N-acetyltransferase
MSLPPDDWLERLIAHEAEYFTMVAQLTHEPFAWFLDSSDLPEYHDANHALRLRDDGRGAEEVARAVISHYRRRGLPVVADLDPVAESQGIGRALRRYGVTPTASDLVLMRYDVEEPPARSERVDVRIVPNETGAGEAAEWIETAASDDRDPEYAYLWHAALEWEARSPRCRLMLGYLDGKPAGACEIFSMDGWARIENVATRLEFRRHGVATAVVSAALAEAFRENNRVIYLFAESGGDAERIYHRLGFVRWAANLLRRHLDG